MSIFFSSYINFHDMKTISHNCITESIIIIIATCEYNRHFPLSLCYNIILQENRTKSISPATDHIGLIFRPIHSNESAAMNQRPHVR